MSQTAVEGCPTSGEERRTYQRYAVDLDALISSSERRWLKGSIRDYCLGGMLVVFADEAMAKQGQNLCANDNVIVDFSLEVDGVIKALSQQCRIARLVTGGFGLVYVDPDPDFIDALREFTRVTIAPKTLGERSLPPARLASKIRKAVSICQRTANVHLPGIYREIFHRSNKALTAYAGSDSLTNLERNAVFDDIQILESLWDKKESVFLGHVHKKIVKMVHKETGLLTGAAGETKYQLALVEQSEFEDWLCITDLATRIQAEHRYSLYVLGQQLASLSARPDEQIEVPVAPNVFGSAIREILEPLRVGAETQQIIFREAADVLTEKLGRFYSHLIDELRSNNAVTETQDQPAAVNGFAQAGPTPRFLTEQNAETATPDIAEPVQPASEETHDSHEELVDLLQQIQGNQGQTIPESRESSPSADSSQPIGSDLVDDSDVPPSPELPLGERVETTGRLLEILRNDEHIAASLVPWIRSLSQPLLKASILDPHFFDNQRHPLRSILNQIDHLGMYIDRRDAGPVADHIASIDDLVEQVVKNPHQNDGALWEVSRQLEAIEAQCCSEYAQNLEQVVLTCEALQRAAGTEQAVRDQINGQLSGQPVPRIVNDLLQTGWLLLLERAYIREGAGGSTWKQYLFVLERLIQRLSKPQQPQSQSGQEGLELYRVVAYALASVSLDPFREKALLDSLRSLLVDEGRTPRNLQPDMQDFEPLYPSGKSTYQAHEHGSLNPVAPQGVSEEVWREAVERVYTLVEGSRVELLSTDGSTRSCRLAWIGDKNAKFVFVDHCGRKAEEFDLAGLAARIHAGDLLVKPDTGTPLIERLADAVSEDVSEQAP